MKMKVSKRKNSALSAWRAIQNQRRSGCPAGHIQVPSRHGQEQNFLHCKQNTLSSVPSSTNKTSDTKGPLPETQFFIIIHPEKIIRNLPCCHTLMYAYWYFCLRSTRPLRIMQNAEYNKSKQYFILLMKTEVNVHSALILIFFSHPRFVLFSRASWSKRDILSVFPQQSQEFLKLHLLLLPH